MAPPSAPQLAPPVGVVLAGGRSRRMGEDKATLALGGETLAARAARRLALVCGEVLVADRGSGVVPGFESVADGAGRGPAAGLLGAAAPRPGRALLALACDLPDVPLGLLEELAEGHSDADWIVPRTGRGLEPLCALWGPRALAALAEQVGAGSYGLHRLAGRGGLEIRYLDPPELARWGEPERFLLNVNAPEDLRAAQLPP